MSKPSKTRCGYDSATLPNARPLASPSASASTLARGMSARRTTLPRAKRTTGPWGRWPIVRAVGTPRCSCTTRASDTPAAEQARPSSGRMSLPRLMRVAVGKRRRSSLVKVKSRVDGEREVVSRGRGSGRMGTGLVYSSSMSLMSLSLSLS